MFDAFEREADPLAAKRFAASTGASLALLGMIALGVAALGAREVVQAIQEPKVDVTFRPPPPPPPPPKVEPPKPKPPPKKVVVEKPAPVAAAPAPITTPKEIPQEKPPEADAAAAVAAIQVATGGTGDGKAVDPNATATSGGVRPINLPENATPPEPLASNPDPEFPAEAKAAGKEALVILKIVVDADGEVIQVKVMRGEEPFVAAALSAVKSWRYRPALVDGAPTAVFRIVKIPFRIRS
jgi:protein TonB